MLGIKLMETHGAVHRINTKAFTRSRSMVFAIAVLLVGSSLVSVSSSKKLDQTYEPSSVDGQILYSPMYSTNTYLRQGDGSLNHTWSSSYMPGVMVRWLGNGTILRTIRVGVGPGGGGAGGGVQIVDWDGTIEWNYRYNTNGVLSHHDVMILPNGNVLLIAWETKTRTQCITAGRNPSHVTNQGLMPDHIIEVHPTGATTGDIVWQWHVWDHLIQDYDSTKDNYGVVADHPELVDINYPTSSQQDLMHTNSIDYNAEFDQIVISVRYYSEIWVIDHSTTTEEAAGHTGGNSGKGGDLLYRWGNPQAYDRGTSADRKLFEQHDTNWVDDGYPGAGDILIFNNGVGRGYSTVDEIVPPVDGSGNYYLAPGAAYGPTIQTWIYNPSPSFYSSHLSGATRLANGDTLICNGETGKVWEVTLQEATVWTWTGAGEVLKIDYIPPGGQTPPPPPPVNNTPDLDGSGELSWSDIEPGATVTGSFQLENIGDAGSLLNWTVNTSSITWGTWSFNPSFGEDLTPEDGQVTVLVSVVAPDQGNTEFSGYLRVENQNNQSDYDVIPVDLQTPCNVQVLKTSEYLLNQILLYSEKISNFLM
jgi:hypothetical protein